MFRAVIASIVLTLVAACTAGEQAAERGHLKLYQTTKYSFEDVVENVELAIVDRGFKIDNHAYVGRMLERTGKALGATKKVYVNAQQFRFCPVTYTRRMLEADPLNIIFCPLIISVYNLPDDPKTVYLIYRRPDLVGSKESKAALQSVDKLLNDLVKEALQ